MKVLENKKGEVILTPDILTGFVLPDGNTFTITKETTYTEVYQGLYDSYDFPVQSLFENQCVAFCPDGYASVNGICLPCTSPCATCKDTTTRCLTCDQAATNPKKYSF